MKKHLREALYVIKVVAQEHGCDVGEVGGSGHFKVPLLYNGRQIGHVVVSSSPRSGCEEICNMARQSTRRVLTMMGHGKKEKPT